MYIYIHIYVSIFMKIYFNIDISKGIIYIEG